jgi:hypothetical protein
MNRTYKDFLPSRHGLFAGTRFDRETVADFLLLFSRAEYALKAAGFVRRGQYDEPKIQWSRFADSIREDLRPTSDGALQEAFQYLGDHPPHRQVLEGHHLRWRPRTTRTDQTLEAFLIESITTVRNNLFHGGKELSTPLTERDRILVRSALLVLAHAISVSESVAHEFAEAGGDIAVA